LKYCTRFCKQWLSKWGGK